MSSLLTWDATHQVAALLDLLPNLRSLKLTTVRKPDYFPVFQPSILYPSMFPAGLQNLTEFSLHWENQDDDVFWASTILQLFFLPSLKTLYLGQPMAIISSYDKLSDITRYRHTSSITDFIIDFGNVDKDVIAAFLKLPKALERFEDSYGWGLTRSTNAEIEEYFSALLPQKSSLKTLKIRGCKDLRFSEDESAPDPSILRSFTSLTEFACPIRLILSRSEGGPDKCKLEDVLPPNIQKLTLFAYNDWTFDKLYNELKHFFSFGKKRFAALRQMRVEVWLQDEDYRLHGGRTWQREEKKGEWMEQTLSIIQSRVESLKIRGKDKGVELEVHLDTATRSESGTVVVDL
jgi:hypothetical protein